MENPFDDYMTIARARVYYESMFEGLKWADAPEIGKTQAIARMRAIEHVQLEIEMAAKMTDGTPVRILRADKGDMVPGYDKLGNRYEAFTTWFLITHAGNLVFSNSRGSGKRLEEYVQIDRQRLEASADPKTFRLDEEALALIYMGVDLDTLTILPQNGIGERPCPYRLRANKL